MDRFITLAGFRPGQRGRVPKPVGPLAGETNSCDRRPWIILTLLLCSFIALQCFLPLSTAIKIGADEDFEFSKATLCLKGYHLYTEIWDDQPPLDTFIITQILKHISPSVLGPRVLTVCFAVVLLTATFVLVRKISGLLAATTATAALLASPGFLELSCSCMQEIPALAPAVTGLAVLWMRPDKFLRAAILGGLLFGFSLQMKFLDAMYLPLAAFIIWLGDKTEGLRFEATIKTFVVFGSTVCLSFVALNYMTGNSLLLQFQQSWAAHFASTVSLEYGSPAERPFDWVVLARNWDTSVPALLGIIFLVRNLRTTASAFLPLVWLAWTLLVFSTHRPWWAYYYIHNALPLCWCAGIGVTFAWDYARTHPSRLRSGLLASFATGAACWMGTRVYLEEASVRNSPRLYSCLVLKEIERFKPFTTFMFSDQPIFSFHAHIPMPPHLAVNNVVALSQFRQAVRQMLRRVLQIRVHHTHDRARGIR